MTGVVVVFCDWSSRDRVREACAAYGRAPLFVDVESGRGSRRHDDSDVLWIASGTCVEDLERALVARSVTCDGVVPAVEQLTELGTGLAVNLGLPTNPIDAVRMLRDKRAMKRRWQERGIRTPGCWEGSSVSDIPENELRFPVIVKPVFGAGSAGVRLVADRPALMTQVRDILRFNRTTLIGEGHERSGFLIEEFVRGEEYAVDLVLSEGELLQAGVLTKGDAPGPTFPDRVYCTDPHLPTAVHDALIDAAVTAVRACGLTTGGAHVEIRIDQLGPTVIEAAARPGAGCGLYPTLESGDGRAFFEALVGAAIAGVGLSEIRAQRDRRSRPPSSWRAYLYNVGYKARGRLEHRAEPPGFRARYPMIEEICWRKEVDDYLPPELTSMAYLAWFRGFLPPDAPLPECEALLERAASELEVQSA